MLTDVWPRFLVSEEFKALSARKELRMLGLDALMAPPTPAPKPRAETVLFLSSHNKRRPWADAWSPLPERKERRRKTPAAAANSSSMFNERQFNSAPGRAPGSAPGSTTVSAPTSPQREGCEARKGVTFSSGTFASVRPPSPVSSASTAPASPKQQAAAAAAAGGSAAVGSDSSALVGATAAVATAAASSESADADADDDCGDESDPVFDGSNPMDAPVSLESIVFAGTAAVSA
jgi:hypothetical protein